MFNVLILSVILALLLGLLIYRRFTFWARQGVPNGWSLFFRGISKPFHEGDIGAVAQFGHKVIGAYSFFTPSLLVADLEMAKKVLISEFANFPNHVHIMREDDFGGQSIFTSKDEQWRKIRQIITPTFSSGKMRKMQSLIEDSVQDLIENIEAVGGKALDIKHYMSGFTMDVIASTAFGTKVNTAKNPNNEIAKHGNMFLGSVSLEVLLILIWPWFAVEVLGMNGFRRTPSSFFSRLTQEIVKKRQEDPTKYARNDFIQFLMEAEYEGRSLTVKEICDNGIVFFIAGHDTSSVTLAHACYCLAINPKSQDKLIEEVDKFFASNDEVTYDAVSELKYLDAVINETLRYLPTVPRTMRVAKRDCYLGDVFVPENTTVSISNYTIHHNPENFERPDEFIPERFLPENTLRHNPQAFLPFAPGPRNCIGIRFAMFEMKLCLLRLLQKFKFERCSGTKVPLDYMPGVVVMGAREVIIKVTPRTLARA